MGFEADFDAHILNFPYQSESIEYKVADLVAPAIHWLEELGNETRPFAIFCKLSWLKANDFAFARQIMKHPILFQTPIVALASDGETIDPVLMRKNGIDDCYKIPVEWRTLQARIEFLERNKSTLLEQGRQLIPEKFEFKIPLSKRVFDIIGASLGLLLSAPIWIIVAIAIKIESKGPVLYKSKRVGAGYHIFDFLKFRSMRSDAETQLPRLQHLNQYQGGPIEPIFLKIHQDPRVTTVGRFIRKYSIDELPQLINVLNGDMSLVGNRPLPSYEAEMLTRNEWSARFFRRGSGLTGLWQVTKRGHADMQAEERIALDIAYSKDYSLLTDMGIIFKTFNALVQKENV